MPVYYYFICDKQTFVLTEAVCVDYYQIYLCYLVQPMPKIHWTTVMTVFSVSYINITVASLSCETFIICYTSLTILNILLMYVICIVVPIVVAINKIDKPEADVVSILFVVTC